GRALAPDDPGRSAERTAAAAGLPLPSALPACDADLQGKGAGAEARGQRHRGLPSVWLNKRPRGRYSMSDPHHSDLPNAPRGDLSLRTLAMPADTNQNGDIFGGWLLSQMDIAGGIAASKVAKSRTVTVSIDAMNFRKPVYVGDLVSVHANLVRVGRTSMTIH